MTNAKKGEELNQISRLLFDKASGKWYRAIIIEVIAGVLGATISLLNLTLTQNTALAIVGFLLLLWSYVGKLHFSNLYGAAETMRRQSVLTEALDWSISDIQFSEWRSKAGLKILKQFQLNPRDDDYYATREPASAKRLLEMTAESAFWTRHLYERLIYFVAAFFVASVLLAVVTIGYATLPESANERLKIIYFLYLFLPTILSIDIFGWLTKLIEIKASIKDVERGLELLAADASLDTAQVMRLVSEYNCQLVSGFPIPNWFFNISHDDIKELWRIHKGL